MLSAILLSIAIASPAWGRPTDAPEGDVSLTSVAALNDPFIFQDGRKVENAQDWTDRAAELNALFQTYELGTLPGKPDVFSASLSNGTLSITTGLDEASAKTWTVSISYPKNATIPGPYPAVIAYGGLSIPLDNNIATIVLNNNNIALQNDQSSRGVGLFFDIYGKDATAASTTAWAWAVGRIIDALEQIPAAESNLNAQRIGVTGCSRNGKGAIIAGALEPRVALTIPQESGSGGSASWRISDAMFAAGVNTQTAHEIVDENVWFAESFDAFVNDTSLLPFDHHLLAGLVAPRPILVIDNDGIDWLGPLSSWGAMAGARTVYEALDVKAKFGWSQAANHPHCSFPTAQQGPQLSAFLQKYLLDNDAVTTDVFETASNGTIGNFTLNLDDWITWETPALTA